MACWNHAVEDIHSPGDGADQVLRRAYAHQVARPLPGHRRLQCFEHGKAFTFRLAYGQAAHGIPVETFLGEPGHRSVPQRRVDTALDDSEERRG